MRKVPEPESALRSVDSNYPILLDLSVKGLLRSVRAASAVDPT